MVLVLGGLGALGLEHHHGISTVGDEVHYLIGAVALGRFGTFQVAGATHWVVVHHWFPGTTATGLLSHVLPTGYQVHGPGIPLLLSLPALGGVTVARVTWIILLSADIVAVSIVAFRSSQGRRSWPMALVVLVATPATFLAMTQLYPDLLAGTIIAALWLAAWCLETGRQLPRWSLVVVGVGIGALPLLHSKNLIPAVLLAVSLVVVVARRNDTRRCLSFLAVGALPVVIIWLVYSSVAFHPGLLPRSGFGPLDGRAVTGALGLLVDSQQGLLIQQPWIVIGCAGIIVVVRRAPWSTGALIASMLLVLGANGALRNTYGGASMVGRFEWQLVVPLAAAGALFLVELRHRRRAVAVGVLAVALAFSTAQGILLLTFSHHAFYNDAIVPGHWHRGQVFGWWPGAAFLPAIDARHLRAAWQGAANWWSVGLVVSAAVAAIAGLLWAFEPRRTARLLSVIAVGGALVCIVGRALS